MTDKRNCWEIKDCGREPGGKHAAEMGVCPAATDETFDGINGGVNGGRSCWAVAGTFCGRTVQGTFAEKRLTCYTCDVFQAIKTAEGERFALLKCSSAASGAFAAPKSVRRRQ